MIEVRNLQRSFGTQKILDGVNLRIETGESVVIIGRSGGGKSVLLKHIIGLLQPESGQVIIDGEDIVPMNERELLRVRHKFGMLFQGAALFDSMTVAENVAFAFRRERALPESEIARKVAEVLEMVDLPGTQNKNPSELSGGMRKRVGLARALMLDPPILVYDEPTSGLDPLTSRTVDDLIDDTRARFGVTSIVITHDIASCFRIADQAVLVDKGRIVTRGPPMELAHGENEIARAFIQQSGVDVEAVAREGRRANG